MRRERVDQVLTGLIFFISYHDRSSSYDT